MGTLAPLFAFAGKAFLAPEPGHLLDTVRELELEGFEETLSGAPLDLEREHVRLFFNPAGSPCPPWQSAQDEEAQLFGDAHHSALDWYRADGVEPNLNEHQPADHIGLLLTFYAHMIEKGAREDELARFRRDHLEWMPAFLDRVAAETRHPFFGELAAFTKEILAV